MKKLFSILLTVAMLLSAVAFPAVVSAEGETVTLSFVINKDGAVVGAENPVYPGDTITVDVMATANIAFTANYSNFFLKYDAAKLTKTALADKFTETTVGQVSYVNDTALEIAAEGTKLGTLTFTVNDNALDSAAFTFASTVNFPSFIIGDDWDMYEAEYAVEDATVAFAASSAVPKIKIGEEFKAIPVSGATYNDAEKIVVKAADIKGNVTVTLSSEVLAEAADLSDGTDYVITEGGDYTITVVPVGGETKTYTFTFAKYLVDATLKIANPTDESWADGYAAGDSFEMPVTISGLNQAKASMIKFSVKFNANALEFDEFNTDLYEVSVKDGVYTVIYNKDVDAEKALEDNSTVANLSFTVKADAAYVTETVTIEALDLALVTTVVNPTASKIGTSQADATATIVPAEGTAFATVADNQVGFTNAPYNVGVDPVANADSKVYYSPNALDEKNAANMFATGDDLLESNNFTVNKPGYYYVVTKIGTAPAVYEVADAVVSKYDGTAPVIAPIAAAESWTSTLTDGYTFDVAVAEEGGSGLAKLEYKLSEDAEYVASASTDEIALAAGTSAEKIWLKATDVAGNASDDLVVVIKIDGVAPTATLEAGTQLNGAVPFTITVGDNLSGIQSVVVKKDGAVAKDVTNEADYAYSATEGGTYTVVVTDNAGNETTSNEVEVEITEAVVLPIKVAIASGKDTVKGGFVAGEVNNGTFRYVKIEKLADEEGFETSYVLTTAPEGAELVFDENGVAEISGIAGAYTLTTTTQNTVDSSDKQIAVYNFNIATSQADMKSVDNNAYFSMFDYAHLMRVTAAATGADAAFTGGLLSADVNADMAITTDDAAAVIAALRAGKYVGIYDFAISGAHDDGAELN